MQLPGRGACASTLPRRALHGLRRASEGQDHRRGLAIRLVAFLVLTRGG